MTDIRKDTSEILAQCLDAIESGEATVESCTARYPEFVDLADLLYAASVIRALPLETLPEPRRSAIRQRVLEKQRAQRVLRAPVRQPGMAWSVRFALPVMVVLFLVLGSGAVLARAADAAVPGDGLYGLKRTVERVQLAVADSASRPSLLYHDAETRLIEIGALSLRGRPIDGGVLADLTGSVTAALAAQSDEAARADLLNRTSAVLDQAQASGALDPGAKAEVIRSLPALPAGGSTADGHGSRTPEPTETPTLTPTLTSTPTETETATVTDTATATDEPMELPTLEPTQKPKQKPALSPKRRPTNQPDNGNGSGNGNGNNGNGNGNGGGNGSNGGGNGGGKKSRPEP